MSDFQIPDKDLLTSVDRSADTFIIYDNSASSLKRTNVNYALDLTSHPVGIDDVQTLTNKTLTAPSVSSPVLSGTLTGTYTLGGTPTFPSSVVTLTGSQTLTNKVLTGPTINNAVVSNPTLTVDSISEFTSAAGVTIDGVLLKDSKMSGSYLTDNSVDSAAYVHGSIDPEHLISGTGSSWAWQSWTPTFTGLTIGNGTLVASYTQVGKTVHFKMKFTLGGTSSVSAASDLVFTLPSTTTSDYVQYYSPIGVGTLKDATGSSYPVAVNWYSTTQVVFQRHVVSGSTITLDNVDSDEPFTWTTSDSLYAQGTYEVA